MYGELSLCLSISINRSGQETRACRVLYGAVKAVQKAKKAFKGNFLPTESGGLFRALRTQAWRLKTRKVNSMNSSKGVIEHKDF